jgi:hypothetical protein
MPPAAGRPVLRIAWPVLRADRGPATSSWAGQPARTAIPGAAELIKIWNYEIGDTGQTIMRLYWDVNTARITGVLDQIRTTLVRLVRQQPFGL